MSTLSAMLRFAGVFSVICGVLAILNPLAATMAAVTLASGPRRAGESCNRNRSAAKFRGRWPAR